MKSLNDFQEWYFLALLFSKGRGTSFYLSDSILFRKLCWHRDARLEVDGWRGISAHHSSSEAGWPLGQRRARPGPDEMMGNAT
jgi:hypothetical protein